jgi:hypothetical protein
MTKGKFWKALKAGASAAAGALEPGEYSAGGKRVECSHCGGRIFALRSVPASGVGLSMSWSGYALLCHACSHVMLFGVLPERL